METKFKSIEELHAAVQLGEIDESKIEIWIDNDGTGIYLAPDDDAEEDDEGIHLFEGNGYGDVETLYDLLFPKAMVTPV